MTDSAASARHLSIARAAVVYVFVFAAVGAWIPYWTVFLQAQGLSLGAIGLLVGVSAPASIIASPHRDRR